MWQRFKKLPLSLRKAILVMVVIPLLYVTFRSAAILLFASAMSNGVRDISDITVEALAKDTGLVFPKDSKVTRFAETPPIDPIWVARVTMPKAYREQFVGAVLMKPAANGSVSGAHSESTPWWKPTNIVLQTRYDHPESSASVSVVVSEEGDQVVAYIEHDVF